MLRDFSLELKTNQDQQMTADDYLEYTLMQKKQNYKIPVVEEMNQSYVLT